MGYEQAVGCDAQEAPIGRLQDDPAELPVHAEEGVTLQRVPIRQHCPMAPLEIITRTEKERKG